ncbi:MAG: hypothetical protein R6X18_14610 [Chloroflexota bacterium]
MAELGEQALQRPDPVPEGMNVTVDDFLADLEYAQMLIAFRPLTGRDQLRQLHRQYKAAPSPADGQRATMWYRLRLASLRWWNHWQRLTLDQVWRGPDGQRLDGTNNASERVIAWWIKERYRTMRTYKRQQSVLNVSRLLAYLGAAPDSPALARLFAA